MRAGLIILALGLAFGFATFRFTKSSESIIKAHDFGAPTVSNATKPDFETQIKPIFQARCQPCHFPGGKVYYRMPFDKPETIHRLGTRLFTRIKDEKEQNLIRAFLSP